MDPVRDADLLGEEGQGTTLSARRNSYLKEGAELSEASNKVWERFKFLLGLFLN